MTFVRPALHAGTPRISSHNGDRAQLIRAFAEGLYRDAPGFDTWDHCGSIVVQLMSAKRVVFVTRDAAGENHVMHVYDADPSKRHATSGNYDAPDSLALEVLSSEQTQVRVRAVDDIAIGVPMRVGPILLGAISVEGCPANDSSLIMLLESCAISAAARLHANMMIEATARYETLAFTDGLTGISNRRRFDEMLALEWRRGARSQTPLCLVMIDVDYFKVYNDTYGHPAGDACLKKVARALSETVQRPGDVCARYGGEEFTLLLPATESEGGTELAERIKTAVATLAIPHSGSSLERVSLSLGVASVVPETDVEPATLLLAADEALYHAKESGRNRAFAKDYVPAIVEPPVLRRNLAANNLPKPLTQLIGRSVEIAEISALLRGGNRLVSLAACGGAGKTRTSIAVATDLARDFQDGAWFIDLSRLVEPALVAPTIGSLFGLEVPSTTNGLTILTRALSTKKCLLVFDNCEHMIAEIASIVGELLQGAADLRILATTREPLGVPGEYVYRLPLLSLPQTDEPIDATTALTYDAVALFCDRAKVAKRGFALTDANARTVVTICQELDGIPLAIELAAARVAVINPAEISRRLTERFGLLRGSDRTVLPRQQTMRALIDWSYDLLSFEEQLIFRRLSVFVGGWTLDAMSDVCAGAEIDNADLFELLSGLVRKSLVIESSTGETNRYKLLESVREYAREKLDADESETSIAHRHATYYLRLAKAARATHFSTASRAWFEALAPELENCRSALNWSLVEGGDILLGAALAGSLVSFLRQVSTSESLRWTQKALELLPPDSDPKIEGALWYGVGRSGEKLPASRVRAAAERTVELYRIVGDPALLADALRELLFVVAWYFPTERDLAESISDELMALAERIDDPIQLALALRSRSLIIADTAVADKQLVLEESLRLLMAHGNDLQTAIAFMWLAEHDFCFAGAEKASTYAREAIRFAEDSGSASMVAQMQANLAQYSAAEGQWKLATTAAREAVKIAGALGMDDQVTWAIQALADVRVGVCDYTAASRLLGFCDSRAGRLHSERQAGCAEDIVYQRIMDTLRKHMNPGLLQATMLVGASMTEHDALQIGLENEHHSADAA